MLVGSSESWSSVSNFTSTFICFYIQNKGHVSPVKNQNSELSILALSKTRSEPLSTGGGNRGNRGINTSSIVFTTIKKLYFPAALVSVQDRKKEALTALKSDLKAQLDKMVKSMDEDNWMFKGLHSRIHLMSRTCAFLHGRNCVYSGVADVTP
ncbi:unnamed protein product [Rhodiola kirilowii]